MIVNKIVRDNIPALMQTNGENPVYKEIHDPLVMIMNLLEKVEEETAEIRQAILSETNLNVLEELADLTEVVERMVEVTLTWRWPHAMPGYFEEIRNQKNAYKGKFKNNIYLESTEHVNEVKY